MTPWIVYTFGGSVAAILVAGVVALLRMDLQEIEDARRKAREGWRWVLDTPCYDVPLALDEFPPEDRHVLQGVASRGSK